MDHTATFVCSHVLERERPVLYVTRKDGDLQCLCGRVHGRGEQPSVVGLGHLLKQDRSLKEAVALPADWDGERDRVGGLWIYTPCGLRAPAKKKQKRMSPRAFDEFVRTSRDYLTRRIDECKAKFHLDRWDRWDWHQGDGTLVFSHQGAPKVVAAIQFAGSVSTRSNTWMWAWANDSYEDNLKVAAFKARRFGMVNGVPKLIGALWKADEVDGWEMTGIAARIAKAQGAYRAPHERGLTFLLFTKIGWA